MKYLYTVILLLIINGCGSTQQIKVTNTDNFFDVLSELKFPKRNRCNSDIILCYKYRQEIYPKLNFINYQQDTVFIMQKMKYNSGTYSESIWNKKGKVEFSISSSELNSSLKYKVFDKEYYPLVSRWATDSIQYYSKKYGGWTHSTYVTAIKVIITNGALDTECISFEEFYNPDKDKRFID